VRGNSRNLTDPSGAAAACPTADNPIAVPNPACLIGAGVVGAIGLIGAGLTALSGDPTADLKAQTESIQTLTRWAANGQVSIGSLGLLITITLPDGTTVVVTPNISEIDISKTTSSTQTPPPIQLPDPLPRGVKWKILVAIVEPRAVPRTPG